MWIKTPSKKRLKDMAAAGAEIQECLRVLQKASANIVGQVIANQGTFYEWNHYPEGDIYDQETHAQYYYHSHPREDGSQPAEHGHFHLFLRAKGMPKGIRPAPYRGDWERPLGNDSLCHLIGISMDQAGFPTALFTTNRWVTGETFYKASDVVKMLDRFQIDHTFPCWATNRWLSAMVQLFHADICEMVAERDQVIAEHLAAHPSDDVYEDRTLEITTSRMISVDKQIALIDEQMH